jgi:hypothetical protein
MLMYILVANNNLVVACSHEIHNKWDGGINNISFPVPSTFSHRRKNVSN